MSPTEPRMVFSVLDENKSPIEAATANASRILRPVINATIDTYLLEPTLNALISTYVELAILRDGADGAKRALERAVGCVDAVSMMISEAAGNA